MAALFNSNINWEALKIIDSFNSPTVIVDKKLNLIYFNRTLKEILTEEPGENLQDLLKPELILKLESFIKNSIYKSKSLVDDLVVLPKSKYSQNYFSLFIYPYQISSKEYFILSFKPPYDESEKNSQTSLTEIKFFNENFEIQNYLSPEIQDLFESVSDIIPLSLVNKNKIKLLLDERDEIIWLRDSTEKIILANKSYLKSVGISSDDTQILSEDYIFFPYQKELLKNLMDYSKNVRKPLLVKGIKYSLSEVKDSYLMIYPVADKLGKNYVFFFILLKEHFNNKPIEDSIQLDYIQLPIIKIDQSKNIIYSNKHFQNILNQLALKQAINLNELFSESLIEKVDEIITSESFDKFVYIDKTFSISIIEKSDFVLNLSKDEKGFINLIFYPISKHEDLMLLLSQRGKTLDYYIQNSPEPIFIFEKETLKFLEINKPALNLYGYSRDEFLKLDLTDLYSPEDFQSLMDSIKKSKEQKITPVFKQKTKFGKDVYVRLNYNEFKYNGLDSFLVNIIDVTDRLLLENENKVVKDILLNVSDIIIETDSFGFIKSCSKNVFTKLGYQEKELIDLTFTSLVRDEERSLVASKLLKSNINPSEEFFFSIKKADENFVDAKVKSIPIKNPLGEVNAFKLLISLEEKLSGKQVEIKEIIKEVVVEKPIEVQPSQSNQNLISTEFLSGVFHEILTPLNVIFGFAQEIVEGVENPTAEQKEAIDIIKQNRVKMLDTMNSVVEYSELISKSSDLNIKELRLVDIIDRIETQAIDISKTFGIEFSLGKISSSLKIKTDPEKLERVIIGLVKIICRIAQEKKIYFSAYQLDNDLCLISISDQYNNISPQLSNLLDKLFNLNVEPRDLAAPRLTVNIMKFFMNLLKIKFSNKIEKDGKTYVGFIIPMNFYDEEKLESKDFEKEFNVKEEIKPQYDSTTFEDIEKEVKIESKSDVYLEEVKDSENKEQISELSKVSKEEPKKKIDLSNLTCLYIEDQLDSQVLFKVQMKELKEVVVAPSFEEALPHLESRKFDFIVIDINLEGEYNGLDALKLIRKIPGYEKTPIFASTAYILPGNKERFIAAGFNSFIDKPIFKERIIKSLSEISVN
ncbi:MAG: PAS domain S-box protein [Ignavibacterium sp.]|nr:PAS domain S-box protein [Ignavibacterium sp.]MDW8374925.1 PAS domain S-box protein [Ignavibacteriales bacterium]